MNKNLETAIKYKHAPFLIYHIFFMHLIFPILVFPIVKNLLNNNYYLVGICQDKNSHLHLSCKYSCSKYLLHFNSIGFANSFNNLVCIDCFLLFNKQFNCSFFHHISKYLMS